MPSKDFTYKHLKTVTRRSSPDDKSNTLNFLIYLFTNMAFKVLVISKY